MTKIECSEEKYALNLNPYQVYIFINEKTKPYLEQFKELQKDSEHYNIVLLPFEASEVLQEIDDSVDPQLYNVITHADVVARMMPRKFGDYRYLTETFFKGKNYDFDYMNYKIEQFVDRLCTEERYSYVNTIRRFFQYGNQEFSDFVMNIFNGNLTDLLEMSKCYCYIMCTNGFHAADDFTREFQRRLTAEQRKQLNTIIKDVLDYNSPQESTALFTDYIHTFSQPECDGSQLLPVKDRKIKAPDFDIVVKSIKRKKLADAEGDYDIQIVKDNGETITLDFGYRGDKMFYLLTLLCQKAVGGLPTKYFAFDSSKSVIKNVYDEVFRSGGDVWVDAMAKDSHKLSVSRTHAKLAIEDNPSLDLNTAYWCNLETEAFYLGPKKKKLQVRRVRLPEDRIIIDDSNQLTQWMANLPSLDQVVGYITPNSAKIMEVKLPKGRYGFGSSLDE